MPMNAVLERARSSRWLERQPALVVGTILAAVAGSFAIWRFFGEGLLARDFVPRLYSYAGKPAVLWTHVIGDTLIAIAYLAISAALVYLAYRGRGTLPFDSMFLAFGLFLVACACVHFLSVWTTWVPVYVLAGSITIIAAIASLMTAVLLCLAVPRILALATAARTSQSLQDRLQMAMESGKTVGWDWDVKGNRDFMFGDLQTIFGMPGNTFVGPVEDFYSFVHPEDRSRVGKAVSAAMKSQAPYAAEFRVVRRDGEVRWISSRGKFCYSNSEPERMMGMAVDVTDRRRAEEEARQKDVELSEAQRLAGLGSWHWDPATDTVLWSKELYHLAGRDPNLPAISYKDHGSLYTAESWERLQRCVEEALRNGTPYELDIEMVPAVGEHRWVTARGEVRRNASGQITHLRGTVLDIAERKRAQDSLDLFRKLIDGSYDAIHVVDPDTLRFLDVNETACFALGYTREELLSMCVSDISVTPVCDSVYQTRLLAGGSVIVEGIHRRKDGSTFPVEASVRLVHLDRSYKIAVVRDVSERRLVEAALEKSEESLRLAAEGSQLGVWDWNETTQQMTLDARSRDIFGVPATGEVSLDAFYQTLDPGELERVRKEWRHALEHGLSYEGELRSVKPDGSVRWIHARGKGYYEAAGQLTRVVGVVFDITQRKQAEQSLSLFRKLIDGSNDAIEVVDPETFRFLDVNEKACQDLGYSREELLSRTTTDVDDELDASAMARVRSELETTGSAIFETRHRRKDGSTLPVEVNLKHVQLDRRYNVAIVRDISERKRAEEALRESEELLRMAVQAGKMFAYSWDAKTDNIVLSGESMAILGIGPQDTLTGEQAVARVHPEDRPRLMSAIASLTPDKPFLQISYRTIRPDQSVIWLERNSRAHFDKKGKLLRITGMVADITKRKLADEALEGVSRKLIEAQEAERSRIARELHDDIGQRLALLSVTSQRASQLGPESAAELRSCLAELRAEAERVSDDIQALSHQLHSASLEHLGMVAAMRGFCTELSLQYKVEVNFRHREVPPDLPYDVSLSVFRVLQEGLRNAVKHSGVRSFDVEVRGTGTAVELTVHDQGAGFDMEAASHSAGLGLTSMRERLKLVGGELSLHSEPNRGTTIRAWAPLPAVSDQLLAAG